jgi:predicted nucleic acid-binding protein
MTRFVLDCSVVMAWCFESEADPYTDAVLRALSKWTAVVPAVWPLEVVNVLLVAERRRRLGGGDVIRFLDLLGGLPIVVDGPVSIPDLAVLLALGREHRLSAYDAAYLHLAMRECLPLATHDRALRAAARAAGLVAFAVR